MKAACVIFSLVANGAIAAATYAFYGMNETGALLAARNTARFSGLVFAAAVVAWNAQTSPFRGNYRAWALAFLAAHYVHFSTIVARHFIAHFTVFQAATRLPVWLVGFSIVTVAGISAGRWKRTNAVFMYWVWAAFVIAFSSRLHKQLLPEGPLVALLVLAMVVHIVNAIRAHKISASAALA